MTFVYSVLGGLFDPIAIVVAIIVGALCRTPRQLALGAAIAVIVLQTLTLLLISNEGGAYSPFRLVSFSLSIIILCVGAFWIASLIRKSRGKQNG